MSERTYPRKVWVLQPSFKPVEVTIVKKYSSWGNSDYGDVSDKGKTYQLDQMHVSCAAAIAHGRKEVERIRADIDKRTDNMCKKIAALDRAEGGSK